MLNDIITWVAGLTGLEPAAVWFGFVVPVGTVTIACLFMRTFR